MFLNKIRNKKLIQELANVLPNRNSVGDLIESKPVKAKDENMYIILHIQFSNEDGTLSHRGKYVIQNNNHKKVGYLKYAMFENGESKYMKLSDIFFDKKYRNIGLGSLVLNMFEKRAKSYEANYITGDLSSIDSETPDDEKLRNIFYLNNGYQIIHSDKIYKEL